MKPRSLTIELDAKTAEALESRAVERGISLSAVVTELVADDRRLDADLELMRRERRGPYADEIVAEDERRLASFLETRQAIPWDEAAGWIAAGGGASKISAPKLRKV